MGVFFIIFVLVLVVILICYKAFSPSESQESQSTPNSSLTQNTSRPLVHLSASELQSRLQDSFDLFRDTCSNTQEIINNCALTSRISYDLNYEVIPILLALANFVSDYVERTYNIEIAHTLGKYLYAQCVVEYESSYSDEFELDAHGSCSLFKRILFYGDIACAPKRRPMVKGYCIGTPPSSEFVGMEIHHQMIVAFGDILIYPHLTSDTYGKVYVEPFGGIQYIWFNRHFMEEILPQLHQYCVNLCEILKS